MTSMAPPAYKELIERLPRTFVPALNDQFRQWDALFPAEQRLLKAQLDWLDHLPPEQFKQLFAPLQDVESRMDLPRWKPGAAGLSIQDTGIIARSSYYPQWRAEVEKVFGRVDEAIAGSLTRQPMLIVCILPAGLPPAIEPLWPQLAGQGMWVQLAAPFGKMEHDFVSSLARRKLPAGIEAEEGTWVIECRSQLSPLVEPAGAVALSWNALEELRREFLSRLNNIRRDLQSADQITEELRRLDLRRYLGPAINQRPRVREFLRAVLLSGNGSLVFNNSFVQWGTSEALRRAQPQAMIAGFGIRQKLKPFSSVVLFEDQHAGNPVPDQDDPAGSLIDGAMLAQYVYLSAQGLSAYQGRCLTMMAIEDSDRLLLLGAQRPLPSGPVQAEQLKDYALTWLSHE